MTILGIEQVTYGVTDLPTCRTFFSDWGLKEVAHDETHARFEAQNGCTIMVVDANDPALPPAFEPGPTLREVTWGVATVEELDALRGKFAGQPGHFETSDAVGCIDPNGMAIRVKSRASARLISRARRRMCGVRICASIRRVPCMNVPNPSKS